MSTNYDYVVDAQAVIADASNIRTGENPSYTLTDFFAMYPAFDISTPIDLSEIIPQFIELADASIKETRFRGAWKTAMGLFIAHFTLLLLQGTASPESTAGAVVAAGQARGIMASKSAGDVSVGYDINSIAQDLNGWAAWKLTIYGQQLATLAKLYGKGGMGVW